MSSSSPAPGQQQWYAGLPPKGERDLDADERAHLATLRREARREWILNHVAIAAILAGGVAAACFPQTRTFALPVVWTTILGLRSRRAQSLGRIRAFLAASLRDLERGRVLICGNDEVAIEVLPESDLLWSVNGARKYERVFVARGATAVVPDHAVMAANFLKPVNENVAAHQRRLSDDELGELRRHMPAVTFQRALLAVLGVAAIVAGLVGAIDIHGGMIVLAALGGFIAWRTIPPLVKTMRARMSIRRDVAERYAVIVRASGADTTIEFLPHSGILWTEDAQPARWRRVMQSW
ncbi:MAG: hypothetical protein JO197_00980 [Acidobacteria bacterium]|nr:hypothetical protein [Acidobacteriota bacterium]MBV9476311.1 hypothetical protein [Acidobacteriota bacterium]